MIATLLVAINNKPFYHQTEKASLTIFYVCCIIFALDSNLNMCEVESSFMTTGLQILRAGLRFTKLIATN